MRIALHAVGEPANRAGKILLSEAELTALGLYGVTGTTEDRRTMAIKDLTGFDVLITDDPSPADIAAIAAEDGLSLVASATLDPPPELVERFSSAGTALVTGVDISAIAAGLAIHELARSDSGADITIGWTTQGSPLRTGEAVAFPDPVGAHWGREVSPALLGTGTARRFEVPIAGNWSGAVAQVTESASGTHRVVGVADDTEHLAAIALAAAAIAVAESRFPSGHSTPLDAGEEFLAAALRVGLGVAAFGLDD